MSSGETMSGSAIPPRENRLAHETSPYLPQHKHNPVDWRPWGPEALAEAKRPNKAILLSVGYAACHWCHVMAHESFEDEATFFFQAEDGIRNYKVTGVQTCALPI